MSASSATESTTIDSSTAIAPPLRFISFSGGGGNSHSMLAGMVAGSPDALENAGQPRSLASLLKSVRGISGNSGGTWFLTMLAYSNAFRKGFESRSETDRYNTTGYNGQTRRIFQGIDQTTKSIPDFSSIPYVGNTLKQAAIGFGKVRDQIDYLRRLAIGIGSIGLNWRNIVEKIVFKPYNMLTELSNIKLSGQRQPWAVDKDLLYGTALQTAAVVMDNQNISRDKVFVSASRAGVSLTAQFTPVTIASLVKSTGAKPEARVTLNGGHNTFKYTNNKLLLAPAPVSRVIDSELDASDLNVIEPTVASSAAPAMVAAPDSWAQRYLPGKHLSSLRNELANFTRDLSPLAQVVDGRFRMPRSLPASRNLSSSFKNISTNGYTRMADGVYIDNQAATNMIRNIQDKYGTQKEFHLTLFANTNQAPLTDVKMIIGPNNQQANYTVPVDIARIFGNQDGKNTDGDTLIFPDYGFNTKVPSSKVFDPIAWNNKTQPDWKYSQGDVSISYFKLKAKTVSNAAFGIKGGQNAQVSIFLASNLNSSWLPSDMAYLDSYDSNFNIYRKAINSEGGFGHIKDAFGLPA